MSMNKRLFAVALGLSLFMSLAACSNQQSPSDSSQENASTSEGVSPSDSETNLDFPGSYIVPDGWVKMEKYSTEDKIFYAEEGHEEDELPDNISVEVKTNRYSAEDHMEFRDAIVRQLTMQASRVGAELTGEGTFTDQEDVLYIFTISEEDVVTKQFYIVGDKRYCLIHLTNFTGSESADEAAQAMADSFVWN
ncbi:hypothetical protein AALA54_10920 [Oscillospiraceae bacterium 44-34]